MSHHTVIFGDYEKVLPGLSQSKVDAVISDPPYGIGYQSNRRVVQEKFSKFKGDLLGPWVDKFASYCFSILKQDRHLYCFTRHDTYPRFFCAFQKAGFTMKRTLIWVKNNHGSGDLKGDYAPQDEWIIYAHKGRRILNGTRISNILHFDKVSSTRLIHPTEKPIPLLSLLIQKSTDIGETILDPFAGSLSMAYAAATLDRNTISVEISEDYLQKGLSRLSKLSVDIETKESPRIEWSDMPI